ncbi:hypothetical protein [Leucothrix mucor]|uniref:hypothetical protein n=1 Tax=Leucothrix mucor TaxID=45248 RepID=UPI0003B6555B|nr:hypothetical protein [Leucothrix mucor]
MKSILIIFCILFMWLVAGVSFYEIKVAGPRAKAKEAKQAKLNPQKTAPSTSAKSQANNQKAQREVESPTSSTKKESLQQSSAGKSLTKLPIQSSSRVVDVTSNNLLATDTLARSDLEIEEAVRLDIQRAVAAQVAKMN